MSHLCYFCCLLLPWRGHFYSLACVWNYFGQRVQILIKGNKNSDWPDRTTITLQLLRCALSESGRMMEKQILSITSCWVLFLLWGGHYSITEFISRNPEHGLRRTKLPSCKRCLIHIFMLTFFTYLISLCRFFGPNWSPTTRGRCHCWVQANMYVSSQTVKLTANCAEQVWGYIMCDTLHISDTSF